MREIKLHVKILRPASGRSPAARVEPCHWSDGYVGGVTAGNESHNASTARNVTAGKMGRNSSNLNPTSNDNHTLPKVPRL